MKLLDAIRAFRKRVDDQILIRQQKDEISRLNNTINDSLKKQSQYHEQHVETQGKTLESREDQLKREFEVILQIRDEKIKELKKKADSFWEAYEFLIMRKVELEKLRVGLLERIELSKNYSAESIKSLNITATEIDGFVDGMNKLEKKVDKLLPEK